MIEWLAPGQNRETEQLYMEVFDDEPEEVREIYPWLVGNNRIVVKKDAGTIAAMVQIVPRGCRLCGRKLILPYVFAVSTKKEYRSRGFMRELLENSIVKLALEQVPMVHLVPAVKHIYEKFGFAFIADGPAERQPASSPEQAVPAICRDFESCVGETECMALSQKTADWQNRHFSLAKIEDSAYYSDMDRIYRCYGGGVSVFVEQGEIVGYQLTSCDGEGMFCEKKVLYDGRKVTARQDGFCKGERQRPFVMGRLLDIPAFLSYVKPGRSFFAALQLSDPILPQNNGYFRFGAADGRFFWEKWESKDGRCDFIPLDIGTLTAVLCGYQSSSWMPKENCLQGIYLWDVF